jgi:hypothetical protein
MAQCENQLKEVYETMQKTSYWFHDIHATIEPNRPSVAERTISRGVQIIFIIIVLIMAQLICPNVLRSLVDLIPPIAKGLESKVNPTQMNKGLF